MILSVVIPVYNVEKYIEKCLLSVIENGFPQDAYEIVVIDDASPDNSLSIVNRFVAKYPNIRVISQENKGLGGARNTGIENASGTFLLFLDADDWYLPGTISKLMEAALQQSVDVLEFGAQGILPDGTIAYTRAVDANEVSNGVEYYQKYRCMDSACNKVYSREFLLTNDLRFVEKLYIEDYEFNTRAFFKAQKVSAISLIAAQFLQSPDSITRNADKSKHVKMQDDITDVIRRVKRFRDENRPESTLPQADAYFNQRLSFLTATLFYQLLKRNFSFSDIVSLKKRLQKEQLFYVDTPIFDKKKNLFRQVFLKNFALLRLAKPLFRYL